MSHNELLLKIRENCSDVYGRRDKLCQLITELDVECKKGNLPDEWFSAGYQLAHSQAQRIAELEAENDEWKKRWEDCNPEVGF